MVGALVKGLTSSSLLLFSPKLKRVPSEMLSPPPTPPLLQAQILSDHCIGCYSPSCFPSLFPHNITLIQLQAIHLRADLKMMIKMFTHKQVYIHLGKQMHNSTQDQYRYISIQVSPTTMI